MPESIKKSLDRLFAEHHVPFKDGLVDEKEYSKADTKLMFLLKEVDASEGDFPDVAELGGQFADEAIEKNRWPKNARSWWNAAKFAYAILNGFPERDYNSIETKILAPYIKKIAWVNLKKGEGAESSNHKDIDSHARNNFDIWYEEIRIIKPDVIICANIFSIIERIYLERKLIKESDIKTLHLEEDWKYFIHEGSYYFDFYHPLVRKKGLTINKRVEVLKQFLKQRELSKHEF